MRILVSGGAGFIGSRTCAELLNDGYDITVFDDLSNSSIDSIKGAEKITGKKIQFIEADMTDRDGLSRVFSLNKYDALIHFAGKKAVGESVEKPYLYYQTNIEGSLNLFDLCKKNNVNKIIFSSSATVYGQASECPLKEDAPLSATNPYGRTKLMIEWILRDLAFADKDMSVVLLRYFNPVGAHASGLIGENPNGIPNNIMPRIVGTCGGRYDKFYIFGNDYDTPDGSCIRDYIHVCDLAKGHALALKYAFSGFRGCDEINLGTGHGISVYELLNTFERVNNVKINYEFAERRPGDVAVSYADAEKARRVLGFVPEKTVEDMCRDSWNYFKKNMKGDLL